jgi:DNA-binding beta-propeller fold protein YncE
LAVFRLNAPNGILFAANSIWVSEHHASRVARIDPQTNSLVAEIKIGTQPGIISDGEGSVWVPDYGDSRVWRVDPTNNVATSIDLGGTDLACAPFAVGPDVWVSRDGDPGVTENALQDRKAEASIGKNGTCLWALSSQGLIATDPAGDILIIDPATARVTSTIPLSLPPSSGDLSPDVVCGESGQSLWIATPNDLKRIDLTTKRITASVPVAGKSEAVTTCAVGLNAIWLTVEPQGGIASSSIVARADLRSGRVVKKTSFDDVTGDVVTIGAGSVWLEGFDQGVVLRLDPNKL